MVEEEKAEVRGGGEGLWDPKQPLHALNFLLGLLHLNSLEQAVREFCDTVVCGVNTQKAGSACTGPHHILCNLFCF